MESNRHHLAPVAASADHVSAALQPRRRSARKTACIPVWLRKEGRGPIWEEETETHVVSRFGAGLQCRHSIAAECLVILTRKDSGQRAYARVRYSQYRTDGTRELGIEFIDKDDFWGLDWSSTEPGQYRTEPSRTSCPPATGQPEPESGRPDAPRESEAEDERLD